MIRGARLAILAVLAFAASARATLLVHAEAAPQSVTIAETVTLTITASTPPGWVIADPDPPLDAGAALGAFTIVSADRSVPVLTPSGRIATTFTIVLAPALPGPSPIPPITLTAREPNSIADESAPTDSITIDVRSVLDGLDPAAFTPAALRPPIVPPTPSRRVPFALIIACGTAIVTALIAIAIRSARSPRTAAARSGASRLDALVAASLPPAQFAQGASAIVRDTLAESIDPRFRTTAAGTEAEILLKSMAAIPADARLAIATFLADAERIACAPSPTGAEADRLLDGARACLAIAEAQPSTTGGAS
jgi:hypothetical protein